MSNRPRSSFISGTLVHALSTTRICPSLHRLHSCRTMGQLLPSHYYFLSRYYIATSLTVSAVALPRFPSHLLSPPFSHHGVVVWTFRL
ncbi:hypothetical protein EXIGLDRAFT_735235 [Exidia glandulosa HHB12029]|uniref:Uncharacterized protein n=1 Tax=Exidia glandulosa HHB12029 TaxID=1314781 RepID=A0A165ASU8_EXIGL|nr:hypothetical protein EXIGLDRAFT_735235 [Exidia glandulosa HHB12029]